MIENSNNETLELSTKRLLDMVNNILGSPTVAEIPAEFATNEQAKRLYDYLLSMRNIFWAFAQGNFDSDVSIKGAIGGAAKSLQANLRHLSWQVQMVANGDFTQRVEFMGEFSSAFNTMVVQFEQTLIDLTEQKELLRGITEDLHREINVRTKAEEALKKSEERYRSLARLDPLTNMYNRRYFFEIASAEMERMLRNSEGVCSIAMMDIDHFKLFNDQYGHVSGDLCLRTVADVLHKQVRRFDVLARYGGEEFILLLPQTKLNVGQTVVERIRSEVEKNIIHTEYADVNITISIGITELTPNNVDQDHNIDAILKRAINEADSALYRAKKNNRNQVCTYDPNLDTNNV